MRFRVAYIVGLAILVALTIFMLGPLATNYLLGIAVGALCVVLLLLFFILFDNEFSSAHALLTGLLFLSMAYLVLMVMGEPSLTTFFLGAMFVVLYLVLVAIISLHGWRSYKSFDRAIEAMRDKKELLDKKETRARRKDADEYIEHLVQEPPRVAVTEDDDGEWIEIKVKKTTPTKTTKKTARKK